MFFAGTIQPPSLAEMSKLASETKMMDYAVPLVNRRHFYTKQGILEDLQVVSSRLNENFKEWEFREADPGPSAPVTKTTELMQQQRNFTASKHNLLKEKETKTTYIYNMIMKIKDIKTRDALLDFLQVYTDHCRYLEKSNQDNEDWILHDRGRLIKINPPEIENVITENENLRQSFMWTITKMRKLQFLRDSLAPYKRYVVSNKPTLASPRDGTIGSDSGPQDSMLEALRHLLASSGADFDDAVEVLENIARKRRTQDEEMKSLKTQMMKHEVELKKVRFNHENASNDHTTMKTKPENLRSEITDMVVEQKRRRAMEVPFKDAVTQTTIDLIFDYVKPTRLPIAVTPEPVLQHDSVPVAKGLEARDAIDSQGTDSGFSQHPPSPAFPKISPLSPSTSAHDDVKWGTTVSGQGAEGSFDELQYKTAVCHPSTSPNRLRMQGVDDSPESSVRTVDNVNPERSTDRKEADETSKSGISEPMMETSLTKPSAQSKSPLSRTCSVTQLYSQFKRILDDKLAQGEARASVTVRPDNAMVLSSLQFKALLLRLISSATESVQFFVRKVINDRNIAREEIKVKDELAKQVKKAESRIRELLRTKESGRPKVHHDDHAEVVKHRKSGEHVCPFCLCHDTEEQVQTLASLKSNEEVEKMARHCSRYIATLGTVEEPFAQLCGKIFNVGDLASSLCSDYMVEDRDQYLKGSTRHFGLDASDDKVKNAADIPLFPQSTEDLMNQAQQASQTLDLFVKETMVMFTECKKRRSDIYERNIRLHNLMELIPKLEAVRGRAGLDFKASSAGGKLFLIEDVLRGAVCPYCNCVSPESTSTPHRETMPLGRFGIRNAMIAEVSTLKYSMERLISSVKTNVVAPSTSHQISSRRSAIIDEAIDPLVLSLAALGKQLENYDDDENQKMFIMDWNGWRRLEDTTGQTEMPLTTVSVPGQGLPKLTGLKHELTDPYFYERHREDVMGSNLTEGEVFRRIREWETETDRRGSKGRKSLDMGNMRRMSTLKRFGSMAGSIGDDVETKTKEVAAPSQAATKGKKSKTVSSTVRGERERRTSSTDTEMAGSPEDYKNEESRTAKHFTKRRPSKGAENISLESPGVDAEKLNTLTEESTRQKRKDKHKKETRPGEEGRRPSQEAEYKQGKMIQERRMAKGVEERRYSTEAFSSAEDSWDEEKRESKVAKHPTVIKSDKGGGRRPSKGKRWFDEELRKPSTDTTDSREVRMVKPPAARRRSKDISKEKMIPESKMAKGVEERRYSTEAFSSAEDSWDEEKRESKVAKHPTVIKSDKGGGRRPSKDKRWFDEELRKPSTDTTDSREVRMVKPPAAKRRSKDISKEKMIPESKMAKGVEERRYSTEAFSSAEDSWDEEKRESKVAKHPSVTKYDKDDGRKSTKDNRRFSKDMSRPDKMQDADKGEKLCVDYSEKSDYRDDVDVGVIGEGTKKKLEAEMLEKELSKITEKQRRYSEGVIQETLNIRKYWTLATDSEEAKEILKEVSTKPTRHHADDEMPIEDERKQEDLAPTPKASEISFPPPKITAVRKALHEKQYFASLVDSSCPGKLGDLIRITPLHLIPSTHCKQQEVESIAALEAEREKDVSEHVTVTTNYYNLPVLDSFVVKKPLTNRADQLETSTEHLKQVQKDRTTEDICVIQLPVYTDVRDLLSKDEQPDENTDERLRTCIDVPPQTPEEVLEDESVKSPHFQEPSQPLHKSEMATTMKAQSSRFEVQISTAETKPTYEEKKRSIKEAAEQHLTPNDHPTTEDEQQEMTVTFTQVPTSRMMDSQQPFTPEEKYLAVLLCDDGELGNMTKTSQFLRGKHVQKYAPLGPLLLSKQPEQGVSFSLGPADTFLATNAERDDFEKITATPYTSSLGTAPISSLPKDPWERRQAKLKHRAMMLVREQIANARALRNPASTKPPLRSINGRRMLPYSRVPTVMTTSKVQQALEQITPSGERASRVSGNLSRARHGVVLNVSHLPRLGKSAPPQAPPSSLSPSKSDAGICNVDTIDDDHIVTIPRDQAHGEYLDRFRRVRKGKCLLRNLGIHRVPDLQFDALQLGLPSKTETGHSTDRQYQQQQMPRGRSGEYVEIEDVPGSEHFPALAIGPQSVMPVAVDSVGNRQVADQDADTGYLPEFPSSPYAIPKAAAKNAQVSAGPSLSLSRAREKLKPLEQRAEIRTPLQRLFGHLYTEANQRHIKDESLFAPVLSFWRDAHRSELRKRAERSKQYEGRRSYLLEYDSLRITPSQGSVRCWRAPAELSKLTERSYKRPAAVLVSSELFEAFKAAERRKEKKVAVRYLGDQSHLAAQGGGFGTGKRVTFGFTLRGKPTFTDVGEARGLYSYTTTPVRRQHVSAFGWHDSMRHIEDMAKAGVRRPISRKSPNFASTMAEPDDISVLTRRSRAESALPAYYVGSPFEEDRFFFENKRSMKTLVRKEAEMDMYTQMKQAFQQRHAHRRATRSEETKAKARPMTVVRKPDMLRHLEAGWQRLRMKQEETAFCDAEYRSLLEDILLYNVRLHVVS